MKTHFQKILSGLMLMFCLRAGAQVYDTNNVSVSTFVGSGFAGIYDGQGTQTMFNSPISAVADSNGNLFIVDQQNARIREVTPGGAVTTFAGGGSGALPGYGTNVSLSGIFGGQLGQMTIDHSNALWITEVIGPKIIRIGPDGYVTEITLRLSLVGYYYYIRGMCVDSSNNLYLAFDGESSGHQAQNEQILKYNQDGTAQSLAGTGVGYANGNGLSATFGQVGCLAVDAADDIYVWDGVNQLIRRMDKNLNVTTVAGRLNSGAEIDGNGTNASFSSVNQMCVDAFANIYLAGGDSIRKIAPNADVDTMAGAFGQSGMTNGAGNLARFSGATGVCLVSNSLFVADSGNQRIRQISYTSPPPVVGGPALSFNVLPGLEITGLVGRQYQIQSSTDGVTWNIETNVTPNSSPYLWINSNPGPQRKSYRAYLIP